MHNARHTATEAQRRMHIGCRKRARSILPLAKVKV